MYMYRINSKVIENKIEAGRLDVIRLRDEYKILSRFMMKYYEDNKTDFNVDSLASCLRDIFEQGVQSGKKRVVSKLCDFVEGA